MMQDFCTMFLQYKIWKGWAIWKHFVRRKKKKLYLASVEKLLFLSNPLLAKVLLQIQTVPTHKTIYLSYLSYIIIVIDI
jgi:hypothetical protein